MGESGNKVLDESDAGPNIGKFSEGGKTVEASCCKLPTMISVLKAIGVDET